MEKKVYIITRSTTINGGDCENKILGVCSTQEKATIIFNKEIINAQKWIEENKVEKNNKSIHEEKQDTFYSHYSLFGGHSITIEIQEFPLD